VGASEMEDAAAGGEGIVLGLVPPSRRKRERMGQPPSHDYESVSLGSQTSTCSGSPLGASP